MPLYTFEWTKKFVIKHTENCELQKKKCKKERHNLNHINELLLLIIVKCVLYWLLLVVYCDKKAVSDFSFLLNRRAHCRKVHVHTVSILVILSSRSLYTIHNLLAYIVKYVYLYVCDAKNTSCKSSALCMWNRFFYVVKVAQASKLSQLFDIMYAFVRIKVGFKWNLC